MDDDSVDAKMQMAVDIAKGMHFIHSKDVVHFDLKPANVLIDKDTDSKKLIYVITDFGFANFSQKAREKFVAGIKRPAKAGITARYAAPEFFEKVMFMSFMSDFELDKKIDVFAYAMTLFFIISREKPWNDISEYEDIKKKVVLGERPVIPEYQDLQKLIHLMRDCWEQNATARPDFDQILKRLIK
jgi:serine/threonine protein kinase